MSKSPVDKSLDDIRENLYSRISILQEESHLPNHLNLKRGITRGFIELVAFGLYQLYQLLSLVLKQAFPDTATGWFLDQHCKQVEIYRKSATKTKGMLTVFRNNPTGEKNIAKGTIFKTRQDYKGNEYRYISTEQVGFQAEQATALIPVEAIQPGTNYNVLSGKINALVTDIGGITVSNKPYKVPGGDSIEKDWIIEEGMDEESDAELRERYKMVWKSGNGLTKYSYMKWAYDVPGVKEVYVDDMHPRGQGSIDIIIRGANGAPTSTLIESVQKVLDENHPQYDDPRAKPVEIINVDIDVDLQLSSGDREEIKRFAEHRLEELKNQNSTEHNVYPLRIGTPLTHDTIMTAIKRKEVELMTIYSPVENIIAKPNQLIQIKSIRVNPRFRI